MRPNGYKEEEFIHFVRKLGDSNNIEIKKNDGTSYLLPQKDMFEIPFQEIEKAELNNRGKSISFSRNNVVNLERYMLWYWSPIIGGNAIILFLHLWEYCNTDDGVDICYPKLSELAMKMGIKDKRTIVNLLNKLQENNFLVWAYRLNKLNNNKEDSPIFKLRQTVPLLSVEQYNELPQKLQKKHDQYMEKFGKGSSLERFTYDSTETIDELMTKSDRLITSKSRKEIEAVLNKQDEEEYIFSSLPDNLKGTLIKQNEFHEQLLNTGMSKPSTETFFNNTMLVYDKSIYTVYMIVRNDTHKSFIENDLNERARKILQECLENFYGAVHDIKVYTAKNYIIKILKGK
jgi:hypothetical protein